MKKIFIKLLLLTAWAFGADIANGEKIYKTTCSFCHSTRMTGGFGRDFNLVSYTRTKEQIKFQISDPDKSALTLGYTANAMPNFNLSEKDIEDVTTFIDSLQPIKGKLKN